MADRYWVGGAGTWNNNSGGRWSNVSGGGGGYGNPGPYDNAIFDGNSGGGNINVATGRTCYNLLLYGFTGTFTGAATTDLSVYGDTVTLTGSSGISMPGNGPRLYFQPGTYTCNVYSYGSTIGHWYISQGIKSVYLQHNATGKNNTQIDNNAGGTSGFYLNGYNFTVGILNNNSGTLDLGTGLTQIIQAGPPNNYPGVFVQNSTLSASSATMRFNRARATAAISSAINSSQTSLTLVDAYLDGNQTAWPSSGLIQIDNELLSYSSNGGGVKSVTLSGLSRGLYGSTAASHSQYSSVLLLGPYFTTLSSAANSGDSTLYVADNSQFPGNGFIEVGGEIIAFSGKSGTTAFTGCTRGQTTYGGTSAAYHASGTTVRHVEARTIGFGSGGTVGTVEFGTNGGYMINYFLYSPTVDTVRAGPYLPANPIGMQYVWFQNSPSIANFKLDGTRGTQGTLGQPIYIRGLPGSNTSTRIYVTNNPTTPEMPYVYKGGDDTDFFDFLSPSGATFSPLTTSYGGTLPSISFMSIWGSACNQGPSVGSVVAAKSSYSYYVVGFKQENSAKAWVSKVSNYGEGAFNYEFARPCSNWTFVYGDVANDTSDNLYSVGYALFGGGTWFSIITKHNSAGGLVWSRYWTGYPGTKITLNPSTGTIYTTNRHSNQCVNCLDYINLRKWNTSGQVQWSKQLGFPTVFNDFSYGVTYDSSDNVYVIIDYYNPRGPYMMRFNSSGSQQWGIYANETAFQIAVITCYNSSLFSSGYRYSGNSEGVIFCVDTSGNFVWGRKLTGGNIFLTAGIATDSAGNVYACGSSGYGTECIIVKYNSSGTIQWQRTLSSSGATNIGLGKIIVDEKSGNFVITGVADYSSNPARIGFVAALPLSGAKTGSITLGGQTFTYAASSYTDQAYSLSFTSSPGGISDLGAASDDLSPYFSSITNTVTGPTATLV